MKRNLIVILIAAFLLAACGARAMSTPAATQPPYAEPYGVGGGGADQQKNFAPAVPPMEAPRAVEPGVPNAEAQTTERMVIKNADLSIVVKDPEAAMTAITKMADDMGGFVVSSNLYQSYTSNGVPIPEANVVIRVPAEKLDEALKTIKKDAVEVQNENVSGQDVTSQYVDLESQLKNLEAAEAQLVEIMNKAEKTEDVINVFNQLTSIRGQIEVIKGQMKYFEESAALSAISVRLIAEETVKPLEVGGWQITGWARDAFQGFLNFLRGFTKFLINLIIGFLPGLLIVVLVFGTPIWLIVRAVRNSARRRKIAQAPKEEK